MFMTEELRFCNIIIAFSIIRNAPNIGAYLKVTNAAFFFKEEIIK